MVYFRYRLYNVYNIHFFWLQGRFNDKCCLKLVVISHVVTNRLAGRRIKKGVVVKKKYGRK